MCYNTFMDIITGKFKKIIFDGNNGYKVSLFRVKETSDELKELINKTITINGYFHETNPEESYELTGNYVLNEKYGYQFQVTSYKKQEIVGVNRVEEFLSSSFINGCGEKRAKMIVEVLGENAINLIKEDKNVLLKVGLTPSTIDKIYKSIMNYYDSDETIMFLKELDFSNKEIMKILNKYGNKAREIVKNNLYSLIDYVDFNKLDKAFFKIFDDTNDMRIFACIIEAIKRLNFMTGDTYSHKDEITSYLNAEFNIPTDEHTDEIFESLIFSGNIKVDGERYYLMDTYLDEVNIANTLSKMLNNPESKILGFDKYVDFIESEFNIKYDECQLNAIKEVLRQPVSIITGGPGTGKTTIIKGLIRMYQYINNLTDLQMTSAIALLAPTGRASKRMSETTNFGASTIHRYLKWNKEMNEFGINEYNKEIHKFVIIDETSMIDNYLMSNLLKGLNSDTKICFVGDEYQLPSVNSGNVLKDLISTDLFSHIRLTNIYRQSDNSFIPILASEVKNMEMNYDLQEKRDDYNFLECNREDVKEMIGRIILKSVEHGIDEKRIQVLIPMYKGNNGIDEVNKVLQNIFNPYNPKLAEVEIGPVTFRVGDKIINLINNVEENIFNGDIGYISEINKSNPNEFMKIDFYGNKVVLKREEIQSIKHAYAMSIHKSQGSEFDHVIMPVTREYAKMLYNKLLYTGISRAKKSLVIIGEINAFLYGIKNNYSKERKTSLKEFIMNNFNK